MQCDTTPFEMALLELTCRVFHLQIVLGQIVVEFVELDTDLDRQTGLESAFVQDEPLFDLSFFELPIQLCVW
jgi:hypothetical protein